MDRFKFIITSIISFIVIVLLQLNIFNNLSIIGIVPDIFIIYCVYTFSIYIWDVFFHIITPNT